MLVLSICFFFISLFLIIFIIITKYESNKNPKNGIRFLTMAATPFLFLSLILFILFFIFSLKEQIEIDELNNIKTDVHSNLGFLNI